MTTNAISVAVQGDGTQIWTNTDLATGDVVRYLFVPVATLSAGDRVEAMAVFRRTNNGQGHGLERVTEAARGALSQNDINQIPAGSFVRMREAP